LGGIASKLYLVPRPEEKMDHLALKLAAYAMFLPQEPIVDPSAEHPALADYDVRPDLLTLDEGGHIKMWVECGEVSLNKLDKITRRLHSARIVVIKALPRQAHKLRTAVVEQIRKPERVEIWTWREPDFDTWLRALDEKIEIFGDAHEKSFNLVVNQTPYTADLFEV
jgi:hypothetical protein